MKTLIRKTDMNANTNTGSAGKRVLLALATLAAVGTAPAFAANVGVSVAISQPGVYGRVDIGRFPQPEVVVQRPVVVQRGVPVSPPVYMWVPPEHRAHWSRYCGSYQACGAPVYFVRDDWYGRHVRPYGPGARHDERRDERHDDRRRQGGHGHPWDERHDGPGNGRGPDQRGPR